MTGRGGGEVTGEVTYRKGPRDMAGDTMGKEIPGLYGQGRSKAAGLFI